MGSKPTYPKVPWRKPPPSQTFHRSNTAYTECQSNYLARGASHCCSLTGRKLPNAQIGLWTHAIIRLDRLDPSLDLRFRRDLDQCDTPELLSANRWNSPHVLHSSKYNDFIFETTTDDSKLFVAFLSRSWKDIGNEIFSDKTSIMFVVVLNILAGLEDAWPSHKGKHAL